MRLCLSRGVGRGLKLGLGFSLGETRVECLRGGRRMASCSMGVFRLGCHVQRGWGRCRSSVSGVWQNGLVGGEGSGTVVGDVDAAYGGVGEVSRRCVGSGGKGFGLRLDSLSRRMQRAWGCGESSRG